MIEIFGYLATAVSVGAMGFQNAIALRVLSIIGSLMWVYYAVVTGANAVLTSSMMFIFMNSFALIKLLTKKTK